MMESTKSGQEGQRKYNTNGKRMNRRGKMVLGMLKKGWMLKRGGTGHVPTDAPASHHLVAQCHRARAKCQLPDNVMSSAS